MNRIKAVGIALLAFALVGTAFASTQWSGSVFHIVGTIELHDGDQGNYNDDIADPAIILSAAVDPAQDVTVSFPDAASGALTVGDIQVSHNFGPVASHVDNVIFIADRAYTVTDIDVSWATAESTGSMDVMVERLQGTEACGSGDDLQTAAVDATGTANTVNSATLTATTANLDLSAGNRLCVDLTATPNEIVNLVVTVGLRVD